MEATEKKFKNEFGEDIVWKPDSDAAYEMNIQGVPLKGGQVVRSHSHTDASKEGVVNNTKEDGYVDAMTFGEGGNATYLLKAGGKVNSARIVRMHRCDEF
jgi:hypothetical protein